MEKSIRPHAADYPPMPMNFQCDIMQLIMGPLLQE
jgi:hypothetical protein